MSRPYKVLVVDDSGLHRQAIVALLEKYPQFQVCGQAADGGEAIKEVIVKAPDLITLDLEMPGMDGFTFLRWLMFARPARVIVVTSRESNRSVFKALEMGALDFLVKPHRAVSAQPGMENELVKKLTAALSVDLQKIAARSGRPPRKARQSGAPEEEKWRPWARAVLVAASTGGPMAVQTLVTALPEDYPVPVLVNQHMPAGFTGLFAKRLASLGKLAVKEAEDREQLGRGVFIAPGGSHLLVEERAGKVRLRVTEPGPKDRYVPSADKMIASAAQVLGGRCVGIALTGMGDDGVGGIASLRAAGGSVIAEDQSTCVVYGMPKAVVDRGLADRVLPVNEIPGAMLEVGRGKWPERAGGARGAGSV